MDGRASRQRASPKCPATSDNPSVGLWSTAPVAVPKILCSLIAHRILTAATRSPRCICPRQRSVRSPFAQGSLWPCGGRGKGRTLPGHRSSQQPQAGRDRSPAPYTSTESADLWADVPKAWLPPAKFRSEIWLAVIGIGPYERTRGYGFPRRFAPRNDSTNAGSRSAGPSSTSFSARRSVRNDRRHRSLPLSSHVSTSPVNARSEAPAPVSPKSP